MQLSIVIPVYNAQSTITECLNSVISECEHNNYSWEILVVDDGSKDNSVDLIIPFTLKYSNIKLIKQPNSGAAIARNTGIKAAQGEFIAFNDSDDKWLDGKLRIQMEYLLNNPDVVMIAGIYSNHNMSVLKHLEDVNVITIQDQIMKNYFSPPTTIIRNTILQKSGLFDHTKRRYLEEGFFFNNIVAHGTSILMNKIVSAPVIDKFIYGDNGLSGAMWKMECGELFNIHSAYQHKYISLPLFIKATCFSLAKYIRRIIIIKTRKQ